MYLPAGWEAAAQFLGVQADSVDSHAFQNARPATDQPSFPVLVFSPAGFPPLSLAAILEEVASHGYVVLGINHTGESPVTVFPDGRVVPMNTERLQPAFGPFSGAPEHTFRGRAAIAEDKAADVHFVVSQLEALGPGTDRLGGRLDLGRLGAFGHSLGGNAALEYCRRDGRCRAAVNLDGAIWTAVGSEGLDRPAMQILADHTDVNLPCEDQVRRGVYPTLDWCEAERTLMVDGWQTVYERARPGYGVMIKGGGHGSFLDAAFMAAAPGSPAAGILATVHIDSRRAWRITCDYLLAFFAKHLNGMEAPLLDGPSPTHPEVAFGPPNDLLADPASRDESAS